MIGATAFGYVSNLWDEPLDLSAGTSEKAGGYCIWGTASSAMTPGNVVIVDSSADLSFKTTTSANSTARPCYVIAGQSSIVNEWDYSSAIASGAKILVLIKGVVLATASAAILRGARVGTSTTAGQVVTTTTQDASAGVAMTAASAQGDQIYVLV